jgi:septal ring factor EnvC (AmiA/AmiB activator)
VTADPIDEATAVVNEVLNALGPPPSRDPSTETWRQALAHTTVTNSWDTASASEQLRQTQQALAASQADLTRAHDVISQLNDMLTTARRELAKLHEACAKLHETCAWRDLAVTAMRERDLTRAQLDDAIATFRAEKRGD